MTASGAATGMKSVYLDYIKSMRSRGIERSEELRRNWEAAPANRRGQEPRLMPEALAVIDAFLYEVTGEDGYAASAGQLLPEGDYALYEYIRAYRTVADSPSISAQQRSAIETRVGDLACRFLDGHVEWGAMNHATNYIVDGLTAASQLLPDHPRADDWGQMAEKMLATSWGKWGIEDSQNYCPIWLMPMVQYADITGRREFFSLPTTVYYFHYFVQLLCPTGTIPEFGDGGYEGSWERYVCLLERGAKEYGNGQMKWAARKVFEACRDIHEPMSRGLVPWLNWTLHFAARITDAYRWCDDSVEEEAPTDSSREVLEDAIGKKIVFRNGWNSDSTYMLLNYMDVPGWGVDGRDQLRTTIPVEAEKTHHGHADENSICMLMSRGALLLNESGYRETDTTGPSGEWRADTYHNRLVARHGLADPQTRLLPFLQDEGRYRFVSTRNLHFHRLRSVDVSRTRLDDAERGYRWDRVVVYLRELDWFVLLDVVKVLESGEYTFADLLYSGHVVEENETSYRVHIDNMGSVCDLPNASDTDLLICFPGAGETRRGAEHVRRSLQTQVCVYQARSQRYTAGDYVAFTAVLVPLAADQPSGAIDSRLHAIESDDGRPGAGVRIDRDDGYVQIAACLDPEAAYIENNVRPRYSYESGYSRYGDLETDARFTCLDVSGRKVSYSLVEATRLMFDDRELFAPPVIDMRQDDGIWKRPGVVRWRAWEGETEL